jgi:CHASE1-domain containing sensor protein
MHLKSRQKGVITLFTLLLTVFVVAMAYWLWRAHAQVSLEIELACRAPAAEACISAKARYMNSFYAAWVGQMFPWILPFVPAFIYVFFFHWLRKDRHPPAT